MNEVIHSGQMYTVKKRDARTRSFEIIEDDSMSRSVLTRIMRFLLGHALQVDSAAARSTRLFPGLFLSDEDFYTKMFERGLLVRVGICKVFSKHNRARQGDLLTWQDQVCR